MNKIINLHTNTEYSLLESTIKIDSLIKFAVENKLEALVITDHNVMHGVPEFFDKCNKNKIKPIIGIDLDIGEYRWICLAKNYEGYEELMRLSSLVKTNNIIDPDNVNMTNIFVIDHPRLGIFQKDVVGQEEYKYLSQDNFYVADNKRNPKSIYCKEVRSLDNNHIMGLTILHSIVQKDFDKNLDYSYDLNFEPNEFQLKQISFIVENCNLVFPDHKDLTLKFPTPNNEKPSEYLNTILNESFNNLKSTFKDIDVYKSRLDYEVNIISSLGFDNYFLVIHDFIKWSKDNDILIGPGRGSSAGSLIAYLLDITEVDPIKYNLLFERFLNPERVTMPDIDIDIQDSRRADVVEYIFNKYGEKYVAQIITFQKMGAKMSLRDSGRFLGMPIRDIDIVSKMIPMFSTLEETYNNVSKFRALMGSSDEYQKLYDCARSIEGLPRQVGTHAAGIVISSKEIKHVVPIISQDGSYTQTQYSMNYLERFGLLKIDLLGLKNLTIIQNIEKEIYKNYNKKLNLQKLEYNDKQTNDLLTSANTNGIFQLESFGMKKTLKDIRVESLDDLAAIISLYRPGPMDIIGDYIKAKNGEQVIESISPEVDKILSTTYGFIVYQEQIMEIAQVFAGMSYSKADILRRAISKKKIELMNQLKEEFLFGAKKNGHSFEKSKKMFETIIKFAQYGFNKSHAYAYSIIAYRMAFLKARFPIEFFTANLNSSISSSKAVKTYIKESRKMGIISMSPNINYSKLKVYNKENIIFLPLNIIKGIGDSAARKIINTRKEGGPFTSFIDFVSRVKLSGVGDSTISSLIKVNALGDFINIGSAIDTLPLVTQYLTTISIKNKDVISYDFDLIPPPRIVSSKISVSQRAIFEEELFGFKMNTFSTIKYETKDKLSSLKLGDIKPVVFEVLDVKMKQMKNKDEEFANLSIEDSTTIIKNIKIFPNVLNKIGKINKNDIVEAMIKVNDFNGLLSYAIVGKWKVLNNE